MQLFNETILRAFLAHMQSQARQLATLYMERQTHDTSKSDFHAQLPEIAHEWEKLRVQMPDILGIEAQLKPWGELAKPGGFTACEQLGGRDPFRITMGVFKDRCDKARRSKPHLTLMRSWDKARKGVTLDYHIKACEHCGPTSLCGVGRKLERKEKLAV